MSFDDQVAALARHLAIAPFRDRLAGIAPAAVDADLEQAVLNEAAKFAAVVLDPLAAALDRDGARTEGGRVRLGDAFAGCWRRYRDAGWLRLGEPSEDGDNPSLALVSAVDEMFNRASPGFCMLPNVNRAAAPLLAQVAAGEVADTWVPRLVSGEWTATICISEPDAGSDVGRIRSKATHAAGGWRVTGEKCWISFGDHDQSARIGHLALARTGDQPGARGLSLFLVPSVTDDGGDNGVRLRRIEEKLGLHCSPTCQIGFEDAAAILLGSEGRGLQTLFPMMLAMRLSCGPVGTGIAAGAFATALGYARDRRQGGDAATPPVAIADHADVRRQLLEMAAALELTRGLTFAAANALDLAAKCPDSGEAARWRDLAQFLLPLVKDGAAWAAVEVSGTAIQVLGGAGYTREWRVERDYRDARILPIFEGTTGIQALDLLHRRLWRDRLAGLQAFVAEMSEERLAEPVLDEAVATLLRVAEALAGWESTPREGEAGATAFLALCTDVARGWIAVRIRRDAGDDRTGARMAAAARFFLAELPARSRCLADRATLGAHRLEGIAAWLEN